MKTAEALVLKAEPVPVTGTARDFLELTKPRLTSLVSLTVLVGFVAGSAGHVQIGLALAAVVGTTLLAAGGCALNMVMERDLDALMERTRNRPLPSGRLQVLEATLFGMALTTAGMLMLVFGTNSLTSFLGALAVVSYLFVYTPLKRASGLNTLAGAVPGALPPMMGWTAATGQLDPGACVLFAILFLWQLPHFLAIAWMRRDDYARGGFQMLTVLDPDGSATSRQVVLQCLALLPASLLPAVFGFAGAIYFAAALLLGGMYLAAAVRLAFERTNEAARALFLTSLVYLPGLLTTLMLNGGPR